MNLLSLEVIKLKLFICVFIFIWPHFAARKSSRNQNSASKDSDQILHVHFFATLHPHSLLSVRIPLVFQALGLTTLTVDAATRPRLRLLLLSGRRLVRLCSQPAEINFRSEDPQSARPHWSLGETSARLHSWRTGEVRQVVAGARRSQED